MQEPVFLRQSVTSTPSLYKYLNRFIGTINVIVFIASIVYFLNPSTHAGWNVLGGIYIVLLLSNGLLIYLKPYTTTFMLWYPFLLAISMLTMGILNYSISNSYEAKPLMQMVVYIAFLLPLFVASISTFLEERYFEPHKLFKIILIVMVGFVYLLGFYFSSIIVVPYEHGVIEAIVTSFSLLFGFVFFAATILISKLIDNRKLLFIAGGIGLIITSIHFLPFLSTQSTIVNLDKQFKEAFQEPTNNKSFLRHPFSIPAYFVGMPQQDIQIEKDVIFYEDDDITLRFDVFMPKESQTTKHPVLVRIHGGAWKSGDKGADNVMQMNKYFADQGYVVYDIQYGLSTLTTYDLGIDTPMHLIGPFTMDDMLSHIGIFTNYLAEHANEYKADLDSVFFSGGSAGGQLATATALAIENGSYNDIFSDTITVKGLIPFYPANKSARAINITGRDEFLEPENLIRESSPPTLIYQGKNDSLVDWETAQSFKDKSMEKGNKHVAIGYMPFAGHASDYYFPGFYNQVFLYYMERFMWMYK
ncbi:alpha/beta hydrolase [Bacillus sp. HMF5848]|uniref:alpha/beta hydrolase n=1 Tax=Bacillus sp. HMF5848 TaxID=2495421 RepID=UPI000F7774A4|nr:alpha/beta hydrolase [Bacillus sp. HMF5848]RSK26614.1 alpha/beta hydrolase [Bacillus sp. HMF5848]